MSEQHHETTVAATRKEPIDKVDLVSHRLCQVNAILHALRQPYDGGCPSNEVVVNTLWGANDLLEEAEKAFDEIAVGIA